MHFSSNVLLRFCVSVSGWLWQLFECWEIDLASQWRANYAPSSFCFAMSWMDLCVCVLVLDFGSCHFLRPPTLSMRSSFLLNTHFLPSGWTLDGLVACFEIGVDHICIRNAWRRRCQWSDPAQVYSVTSSFSFYITLLFATVTHIISQCKALTLMKKNRITCCDQKWSCVHDSICKLSNTQCRFTSHSGPMFTHLTGSTVINSA